MNILLGIVYTTLTYSLIILVRNEAVFRFRQKLIKNLDQVARDDIALTCLVEMGRVRYVDMVWQWWKPLRSFYSKDLIKLLD